MDLNVFIANPTILSESIPDLPPLFRRCTTWGYPLDIFAIMSGTSVGGFIGLDFGLSDANAIVTKDPESRMRIEQAFLKLKSEALRRESELWRSNDIAEDAG